jgi:hypothetical protein
MCYDGDASAVWSEKRVRARKGHKCYECGSPIPRGFDYHRINALDDGLWSSFAVHVECLALWYFVQEEVCGGHGLIMLGGLDEELIEYGDESLETAEETGEPLPGQVSLRDIFACIRDGYAAQAQGVA